MKKKVFSVVSCFVFALSLVLSSCSGGAETTLTNEGVYGEVPNYVIQYLDLKQKCADELEFEDNQDKRVEIKNKYAKQWDEIYSFEKQRELKEKLESDTLPIVSHKEVQLYMAHLDVRKLQMNINGKLSVDVKVNAKYKGRCLFNDICAFLDENDSIVGISYIFYERGHNARISLGLYGNEQYNKKQADILRLYLYAFDKAKKLVILTDEEVKEYMLRYQNSMKTLAEKLVEKNVIDDIDELTEVNKKLDEEKPEVVDVNKPGDVDLAYFELRGKVKSFTERNDDNSISYSFNEKGKWNTYNGRSIQNALSDVERDAQKRIIKYTEGEYDCIDSEEITYDSKTGWVSKIKHNGEGEDITTFTYDEKGYLIKKVCEGESWEMGAEEGEKFKDTTTYTYESFDEHGNWTARSAKSSDGRSWKETRRIQYYK